MDNDPKTVEEIVRKLTISKEVSVKMASPTVRKCRPRNPFRIPSSKTILEEEDLGSQDTLSFDLTSLDLKGSCTDPECKCHGTKSRPGRSGWFRSVSNKTITHKGRNLIRKSRFNASSVKTHYLKDPVLTLKTNDEQKVNKDPAEKVKVEKSVEPTEISQSCSQQAMLPQCDDITINELAAYFDTYVHIPKKMSLMAEMMYT